MEHINANIFANLILSTPLLIIALATLKVTKEKYFDKKSGEISTLPLEEEIIKHINSLKTDGEIKMRFLEQQEFLTQIQEELRNNPETVENVTKAVNILQILGPKIAELGSLSEGEIFSLASFFFLSFILFNFIEKREEVSTSSTDEEPNILCLGKNVKTVFNPLVPFSLRLRSSYKIGEVIINLVN